MDTATPQVFEAGMLVCFGVAWPVDIFKTLQTRQVAGKSAGFMALVLVGYLAGMAAKIVRAPEGAMPEAVSLLYALNAAMVCLDILLYLRFRPSAAAKQATVGRSRDFPKFSCGKCEKISYNLLTNREIATGGTRGGPPSGVTLPEAAWRTRGQGHSRSRQCV